MWSPISVGSCAIWNNLASMHRIRPPGSTRPSRPAEDSFVPTGCPGAPFLGRDRFRFKHPVRIAMRRTRPQQCRLAAGASLRAPERLRRWYRERTAVPRVPPPVYHPDNAHSA